MALKLNKFSSRILPSRNHTPLEAIATMLFFLLILSSLGLAGYKARVGAVVYLYAFAGGIIGLALLIELYFLISNWVYKNWGQSKGPESF